MLEPVDDVEPLSLSAELEAHVGDAESPTGENTVESPPGEELEHPDSADNTEEGVLPNAEDLPDPTLPPTPPSVTSPSSADSFRS